MDTLPTPLSRIELYLAKIAGVAVTIPEKPMSRLEMFLAVLAGDTSVAMPAPMSRTELWLAWIGGITPSPLPAVDGACYIGPQKVDVRYFARAAGMPGSPDIPEPQNRTEQYWYQIASNVPIVGFLKYATGVNLALTDILSGIEELQFVYGDTFQQTYSGKNLWGGFSADMTRSTANINFNNLANGDIFIAAGTSSGQANSLSSSMVAGTDRLLTLEAGTYTISGATGVIRVQLVNNSGTALASDTGNGATITLTSATQAFVRVSFESGQTVTDTTIHPQLEIGSTATPYEPYVGGIPSPNPDYPQAVNVVTGRQVVEVYNKNLWNMESITASSANVTITGPDSSGEFSLSWTGGFDAILSPITNLDSGSYYAISFKHKGAALSLRKVGSTTNLVSTDTDATYTTYSFVMSGETGLNFEFIRRTSTTGVTAYVKDFQIELGTNNTDFEVHQSYEVNLGKNLFDKDNYSSLPGYFDADHAITNGVVSRNIVLYIPCEPNTVYSLQRMSSSGGNTLVGTTTQLPDYGISVDNISGWNAVTDGYLTGPTAQYLCLRYQTATSTTSISSILDNLVSSIQIEKGPTATPYAPYFTPIELCKIGDYQDYIYKSGDDWYVHKETGSILLTGNNITRVYYGCPQVPKNISLVSFSLPKAGVSFYTNNFIPSPVSLESPSTTIGAYSGDSYLNFRYGPNAADLQAAQDWFNAHNTTLYAPLVTPTDTKITDATLISQLNALDSAVLPKPNANITVTASDPNLPGAIKISYYTRHE